MGRGSAHLLPRSAAKAPVSASFITGFSTRSLHRTRSELFTWVKAAAYTTGCVRVYLSVCSAASLQINCCCVQPISIAYHIYSAFYLINTGFFLIHTSPTFASKVICGSRNPNEVTPAMIFSTLIYMYKYFSKLLTRKECMSQMKDP